MPSGIYERTKKQIERLKRQGFQRGHKGYMTDETRKKISISKMGKWQGEKHPNWKGGDRKKNNERNDSLYQWWVQRVKKRDDNQCTFKGQYCSGYNIVHHILSWRNYPELRYNINNGITLCQYHHPQGREDETKMTPIFQNLVISKAII